MNETWWYGDGENRVEFEFSLRADRTIQSVEWNGVALNRLDRWRDDATIYGILAAQQAVTWQRFGRAAPDGSGERE